MSRWGRLSAIGAVILAAVTVAFWNTDSNSTTVAATDGATLFQAKGCASCHDGPDSTARPGGAPSLRNADTWADDRQPGVTAEEYIAESIDEPGAFISPAFAGGSPSMPTLDLTQDEIDAIVDYLLSK